MSERRPSIDLLPSAWSWWQPITFGFLAGVGWKLLQMVWPVALGLIGRLG